jgi:hypothetical protein
MQKTSFIRRISQIFLWLVPLPFLTTVYRPGGLKVYFLVAAFYWLLIGTATWILGGNAIRSKAIGHRDVFVAAALLVASWAVTLLALNMDTPPRGAAWLATQADQQLRYLALVVGGLLSFGGLAVLTTSLHDRGQRILPTLGLAATAISTVLFTLIFLVYPLLTTWRFEQEARGTPEPDWLPVVSALMFSTQALQRLLVFLAAALFACSVRNARLMGTIGTLCFIVLTLFLATANVLVHVPPAVPFVLPYLIGVILLQPVGAPKAERIAPAQSTRFSERNSTNL